MYIHVCVCVCVCVCNIYIYILHTHTHRSASLRVLIVSSQRRRMGEERQTLGQEFKARSVCRRHSGVLSQRGSDQEAHRRAHVLPFENTLVTGGVVTQFSNLYIVL
jgi:hypothetical protein